MAKAKVGEKPTFLLHKHNMAAAEQPVLLERVIELAEREQNETGFIRWAPFTGEIQIVLTVLMFIIAAVLLVVGARMKMSRRLPMPWTWLKAVIVIVWILQILVLLRIFKHIETMDPSAGVTGPVLPVTLASAAVTFVFVTVYLLRCGHASIPGALGCGVAAAFAGPMVFELPFVLIVGPGSTTPTNPGATLTIPFFIAMFTTMAFLAFSSKAKVTKYSIYSLAAMFAPSFSCAARNDSIASSNRRVSRLLYPSNGTCPRDDTPSLIGR